MAATLFGLVQNGLAAAGAFVQAIQHNQGGGLRQRLLHYLAQPPEFELVPLHLREALLDHRGGKSRRVEAVALVVVPTCQ